MDDGADLTSIIRLKPLKSEPEENGRERKRESERARENGETDRVVGSSVCSACIIGLI